MRREMDFQTVRELSIADLEAVFGGEEVPEMWLPPPVDPEERSEYSAQYTKKPVA
jgi:hypothetical protein